VKEGAEHLGRGQQPSAYYMRGWATPRNKILSQLLACFKSHSSSPTVYEHRANPRVSTQMAQFRRNPAPPIEPRTEQVIRFLHPGYEPPTNALLALARVDRTPEGAFGVHCEVALLACQIIANNAFETGSFALDQSGLQRVSMNPGDILTENAYYFIIGDGPGICWTLCICYEILLTCLSF
jgi:hypothetical protein